MSLDGYRAVLVLGGIRSGKSGYAETLVATAAEVRYVATAAAPPGDADWAARVAAHRERRPATWRTEEIGADPGRLAALVAQAGADETLLIDDLGGWLTAVLDDAGWSAQAVRAPVAALAGAVRACAARLVIVSPEVGLSVVPATESGRVFADAVGEANQLLADACDRVMLVVAGLPTWLKGAPEPATAETPAPLATTPATTTPATTTPATTTPATIAPEPPSSETAAPAAPAYTSIDITDEDVVIGPRLDLPLPDEEAAGQASTRLTGSGLGRLARAVSFTAGVQATATPSRYRSVRVLLVHGGHQGGVAAGDDPQELARLVERAGRGEGPLGRLAAEAGARVVVVDAGGSDPDRYAAPIEDRDAIGAVPAENAMRRGWRLADAAVDEGADLLVLAAAGAGQEATAAAVVAANTALEPAALLPRVYLPGGRIDDEAWMRRCAAVRDAMRRIRGRSRQARAVLAALAGEDIAVAVGVLLGATARRTPVLVDGPVGLAAGILARDLAGQVRHWALLVDHHNHPTVRAGAEVLGLDPVVDLGLGLGEGTTSLALLPLMQSALSLSAPDGGAATGGG